MARDTRRDLVACFTWKRVRLGFPSFASKLVEELRRVVYMALSRRSRRDEAEDGSVNATDCIGLFYPNFAIFVELGH
jgi:hypothetical protein